MIIRKRKKVSERCSYSLNVLKFQNNVVSSIISENTQIDLCISLTPFGKLIPVSSLSVIRLKFLRLDNLSFKFTSELINTKNYLIIVDLYKYLLHI